MKIKHLHLFAVVLISGAMLTSCHSDIDINNVDTTAELEMGVALPIGSMHATVGDFLGNGQVSNLYFEIIDNNPVLTFRDTFTTEKNFHADSLDLTRLNFKKDSTFNVYDHLEATTMIGTNKQVTGDGSQTVLRFKVPVSLNKINKTLNGERIDSAQIIAANLNSVIYRHNLPLEWNWIDEVTLELGDQIIRSGNKTVTVYRKGDGYGYGREIPFTLNDFSINLLKDQGRMAGPDNMLNECTFYINFKFTIPNGTVINVPSDAGFNYYFDMHVAEYKAVWGKFMHSNDMYDEDEINLEDYLGEMSFITRWCVPFDDPRIDVYATTRIAGSIMIHGQYLYTIDADGNRRDATFWDQGETHYDDYTPLTPGRYLDPHTSNIGDSATYVIHFDKTPARGHLDRLFDNIPKKLGYKFDVDFNYDISPQIRLVPNTSLRVDAIATLPFIFRNGLFLNYSDTVDVDLSQADIDSIINEVEMIDTLKATDIKLVLKASNTLPFDIKATLRCLDAAGKVIMDPDDPTKPFQITQEDPVMKDTILIHAPSFYQAYGSWYPDSPGESVIIASVNKNRVDMLPLIKHIVYYAQIDESSLKPFYDKGMQSVRVYEDCGLRIWLGLTTHLDAIFNFNNDKNK